MNHRNIPHTKQSLLERSVATNECFIWQGAGKGNGYGVAVYKGKQTTVHRVMYMLVHGAIPDGYEVDHTCNNRACINPDHLQSVSHAENMYLATLRRVTCKTGHEWNDKNTYVTQVKRKQGGHRMQRYCRVCRAEHQADLRKRRMK
jgi:hypothetical protein